MKQVIEEVPVQTAVSNTDVRKSNLAGWLTGLVLLVFLMVLWGGLVRLTGSGLSIPEWPLINGSLLPPISTQDWQAVYDSFHAELANLNQFSEPEKISLSRFKQMFAIEYIHRTLAAVIGIMFLIILVKGFRHKLTRQQVKWHLAFSGILLLSQAILGGVVVKNELQASLVALHLGAAFLFFGLLLWTALYLSRLDSDTINPTTRGLKRIGWIAVAAIFIQVLLGGLTAGTHAGLIFNTFPKMGDFLVPPLAILFSPFYGNLFENLLKNQILIQFLHRWWAFVALLCVAAVIFKGTKFNLSGRGRLALQLVGTVTVFQVLLGILNLLLKVPVWTSLVHLGTALLIFGLTLVILHDSKYGTALKAV